MCRLVHDQLLLDERSGDARFADFTDEKMAKLFEDFVTEFYRRELVGFRVNHSGRRIKWNDDGTSDSQRSMIPRMEADVILETADRRVGPRRIVLDTKFYRETLSGHYGGLKLRSNHLYQLLAYLRTARRPCNRVRGTRASCSIR